MPHLFDELDSANTFWKKLWLTVLLLVFGTLIAPLLFIATQLVGGRYGIAGTAWNAEPHPTRALRR